MIRRSTGRPRSTWTRTPRPMGGRWWCRNTPPSTMVRMSTPRGSALPRSAARTSKELYKFKTPSGIIGNVTTYEHRGKQYIAVLSGVGGWAGIGLAAGLTEPTAGLGAVGGYAALSNYTSLGGQLTVFAVP